MDGDEKKSKTPHNSGVNAHAIYFGIISMNKHLTSSTPDIYQ